MKHNALGGTSEEKYSESGVISRVFLAKRCAQYINSIVIGMKFLPQMGENLKITMHRRTRTIY